MFRFLYALLSAHPVGIRLRLRNLLIGLGISLGMILAGIGVYQAFTHYPTYRATLGTVARVFSRDSAGKVALKKQAFVPITEQSILQWDAVHYNSIKNDFYGENPAVDEALFAFFPGFPLFWKLTGLTGIGIALANTLLYSAALWLMISALASKIGRRQRMLLFALCLVLPHSIFFSIPYAESLFLFVFALGFWGLMNNKYWLFALGMFLMGTTRSALNILGIAILCSEFLFFAFRRRPRESLRYIGLFLGPPLLGTITAVLIQASISGSPFSFIYAQKHWGHGLHIPKAISDWSQLSYCLALFCICFAIILPIIVLLKEKRWLSVGGTKDQRNGLLPSLDVRFRWEFYSVVYCVGVLLFTLISQAGNLHGLARYTSATPFFYIIFLGRIDWFLSPVKKLGETRGLILLSILSLAGLFAWAPKLSFQDFGLMLFLAFFWFFYYWARFTSAQRALYAGLLILLGLVWKAFMMSAYIADAYLFT